MAKVHFLFLHLDLVTTICSRVSDQSKHGEQSGFPVRGMGNRGRVHEHVPPKSEELDRSLVHVFCQEKSLAVRMTYDFSTPLEHFTLFRTLGLMEVNHQTIYDLLICKYKQSTTN